MSRTSFMLSPQLARYVQAHVGAEDPALQELRAATAELPQASMQVSVEQGRFLGLLVELMEARRILEIGTFTGYSALSMALRLPKGGSIVTLDASAEWTAVAQRYWDQAGVTDVIDLQLGPALESLARMPGEPTFDLVFLDADKPGYPAYFRAVVPLLRDGGLLLADNVLAGGRIADDSEQSDGLQGLRAFNDLVQADDRLDGLLLPAFDGLTMARRR